MDDIYREIILDHFKNPRNFGRLKNPTASFYLYNSACGDKIEMQIKCKRQKAKGKIIEDLKFHGEGCALSTASASMLTEKVKGFTLDKAKKLGTADILKMLGINPSPTRIKCVLLPLEVLQKTLSLAK